MNLFSYVMICLVGGIRASEISDLRSELESVKLELKNLRSLSTPSPISSNRNRIENERVMLSWLKDNVLRLQRELEAERSERSSRERELEKEETEFSGRFGGDLGEFRTEMSEIKMEQDRLEASNEEVKSNIDFYNEIRSPKTKILSRPVRIRTKNQVQKEFRKVYSTLDGFFRRLVKLEEDQKRSKENLKEIQVRSRSERDLIKKTLSDKLKNFTNVSKETFQTIRALEEGLNSKIISSQREAVRKVHQSLESLTSRQSDVENSIGEIVRKLDFKIDTDFYKKTKT